MDPIIIVPEQVTTVPAQNWGVTLVTVQATDSNSGNVVTTTVPLSIFSSQNLQDMLQAFIGNGVITGTVQAGDPPTADIATPVSPADPMPAVQDNQTQ